MWGKTWLRGNFFSNSFIPICIHTGPPERIKFVPNESNNLKFHYGVTKSPKRDSLDKKVNKTGLFWNEAILRLADITVLTLELNLDNCAKKFYSCVTAGMQLFREEIQILGNFGWQWSEVSFPTCNQGWLELMWLTWGKILYLHVTLLRHTAKPKFQGQEFSVSQNTYYCVYPHDNIWCYRCPSTVCCFAQRLNMALSRCSLIQYCVLT